MKDTKIQWCDDTCNFITGCDKVSEGCAHCYAEAQANRFPHFGEWGPNGTRKLHESAFKLAHRLNRKPLVCDECGYADAKERWHTPHLDARDGASTCECSSAHTRRFFSLSMGDWLDPQIPVDWLARMLSTIQQCDQVNWLLLTKRPERFNDRLHAAASFAWSGPVQDQELGDWLNDWSGGVSIPTNIWLGASVENQSRAEERIPALLRIPAAKQFLSCEPLLGPVDIARDPNWLGAQGRTGRNYSQPQIDWVIVGGESGPKARPCHREWIRNIVVACKLNGVACFVKQVGSKPIDMGNEPVRLENRKGGDPAEWPPDLRVREFPQ